MPETIWRASLVLALYRNRHVAQAQFLQLATIRGDGRPAARTVVFRGFLGESEILTIATDIRSAKVRELETSPWAEACWYFPMTREQFRLSGRAAVIREDTADASGLEARLATWSALTDPVRQTFTWPAPAEPRDSAVPFVETPTDPASPEPTFGLIVLEPDQVDHLELDGSPQNRWTYHRDEAGHWSAREINP